MRRICGRTKTAVLVVGVISLLIGLSGCKQGGAVKHDNDGSPAGGPATQPPVTPLDQVALGTVSGTVRFAGKTPGRVKIDMSMDPVCSITGVDNFAEQYVVNDSKLANVYVYIKSGPPAAMSAPAPTNAAVTIMDQVGCKYVPHVAAVMRGGSVEFRNSDGTMHNIHTLPAAEGSQPLDISQGPKGEPQIKQFNHAEVMLPVRCNNHPWMNAFINVSETPFFAVTGTDGRFNITGLPAGTYTLGAVHEKMGEQTLTITIEPKGTAKADFSFSAK